MEKHYTRACNFYYGQKSIEKVKSNSALSLNNNKLISFDTLEIITRNYKKKNSYQGYKFTKQKINKKN